MEIKESLYKIFERVREALEKIFEPENITKMFLRIAEVFFIIAAFGIIGYTFYNLPTDLSQGFEPFVESVVGNTFLLVALMEIYEGVADLEKGKARSALDVMDAATSFLLREVIETVYEHTSDFELLLTYGALVLAIAGARLLISYSNIISSRKKVDVDEEERVRR